MCHLLFLERKKHQVSFASLPPFLYSLYYHTHHTVLHTSTFLSSPPPSTHTQEKNSRFYLGVSYSFFLLPRILNWQPGAPYAQGGRNYEYIRMVGKKSHSWTEGRTDGAAFLLLPPNQEVKKKRPLLRYLPLFPKKEED